MDQIEEIKQKVNIADVVGEYVTLKRGGKNLKGLCPFHGEKTPSFMVNESIGIYKCFGCGKGGDAISFVMEMEKVDFPEALEILAEKVGVKLVKKGNLGKDKEKGEMLAVHDLAREYYHYLLTKHPVGEVARKYLSSRDLGERLINEFKLGYSVDMWDGLYQFLVVKKGYKADLVERAGLVTKRSGGSGYYDRFRGRVMFPISDHRGRVIAFAGRVIPGTKGADEAPKYINSPESPIFHKSRVLFGFDIAKADIKKKDRVVVVEGELDMIRSFAAGVGETVAIKGSALTEDQVEMLSRVTKNLVLALDADAAGDAATKRGIEIATNREMAVKVLRLVGGKDPDDVARDNPGKWTKMIGGAVDVYEYYINSAVEKYGVEGVEAKRKISGEVLPQINRIGNQVVKSFYVKKLASVLGMSEEVVMKEMERVRKDIPIPKTAEKDAGVTGPRDRKDILAVEILSLLLAIEKEPGEAVKRKLLVYGVGKSVGKVLDAWWEWIASDTTAAGRVVEFIKQLPEELQSVAQEAYLIEHDESKLELNLAETVDEWERIWLEERSGEVSSRIKAAEEGNDDEGVKKWTKEFVSLQKVRQKKAPDRKV